MESEQHQPKRDYILPVSILVAAVLVAGALVYTAGVRNLEPPAENQEQAANTLEAIKSVTSADHIRGNANAKVKIIEFSDLECPFCKTAHATMQRIVSEYKDVAWVYRHFPLDTLHPKAPKEAEASECAAELGGPAGSQGHNDAFWKYVDKVFEITPSNNGLSLAKLPEIAEQIGLDRSKFENCLDSGKYAKKVSEQFDEAVASGGNGTPYFIVIDRKGARHPISGALPYSQFKPLIEDALK